MKKKIMASLLGLSLIMGGTHIFAATVLDTNIIDLIKNKVMGIGQESVNDVDKQLEVKKNNIKKAAVSMIVQKESDSKNRINDYKEQQLKSAETEMNQFTQQVGKEVDSTIKGEEETAKTKIKSKKDEKVDQYKKELLDEIEKELK